MKRLCIAFFTICFVASSATSCVQKGNAKTEAKPLEQITVLNIRGGVSRQSAYTFQWKPLSESMRVYTGDLLSLDEGGTARVFYDGRIRAIVELRGPTFFRIDRLPPTASSFKSLNHTKKSDKGGSAVTQGMGVISHVQTRPINFLWPLAPMTIVSDTFPVKTRIAAALPYLESRLILSLYDLSGQGAEVWSQASASGRFNNIVVPKAGMYRVIVRSDDGRYLNESLTIEARKKIGDSLNEIQNRVVEIM